MADLIILLDFNPNKKNSSLVDAFNVVEKIPEILKEREPNINTTVINIYKKTDEKVLEDIKTFENSKGFSRTVVLYAGWNKDRIKIHSINSLKLYERLYEAYDILTCFRKDISFPRERIIQNIFIEGIIEMLY